MHILTAWKRKMKSNNDCYGGRLPPFLYLQNINKRKLMLKLGRPSISFKSLKRTYDGKIDDHCSDFPPFSGKIEQICYDFLHVKCAKIVSCKSVAMERKTSMAFISGADCPRIS